MTSSRARAAGHEPVPGRAASPPLVFSRRGIRALDRACLERFGIPGLVLMENAGRGVAEAAFGDMRRARASAALVLCGPGNNGGDGLVAARHLANFGVRVGVVRAGARAAFTGDGAANLRIVRAMKIPCVGAAAASALLRRLAEGTPRTGVRGVLLIDALLGTGLARAVEPASALGRLIAFANAHPGPVLAVDLPSGMDADTGAAPALTGGAPGAVIRPDSTVTLVGWKRGFARLSAPARAAALGVISVVDIGCPAALACRRALRKSGFKR
ncbi:hypothetical protein BH11PLA1_BH11PLA1_12330 [soil metagenome]